MYAIEKTLGPYSCAFRQPGATHSHCHLMHGYGLMFDIRLESETLDFNNWVFDFGKFKPLKQYLEDNFDHKTVIAADDPEINYFIKGHDLGVLELVTLQKGVGCEKFAKLVFDWLTTWINKNASIMDNHFVTVKHVRVREHQFNMAEYSR